MQTDNDLERRLRNVLRQELDAEHGPDPSWDESPGARRVAQQDRRRPRRRTLGILAVAALITIGGGAALILGNSVNPPIPPAANGWIAQSSGGDIYFLTLDSEVRRVIGTSGDDISDGCPAFSPDGRQLAWGRVTSQADPESYRDATLVIGVVADDGQVTEQLTTDVGDGPPPPCPVWSPTGDRIAYAVPLTSTGNPTTGAAGSEVRILTLADRSITVLPDLLATDLEFSPDGSLLAIASGTEPPPGEGRALPDGRIYLYEFAAGALRRLDDTLGALTFTWSPEGGRIAYMTGELDPELRVIDLTTEEQRVLDPFPATNHGIGPVWSPDGESILYQRLRSMGGERHDVILVWPDDLASDGTPREEVFTLFDQAADGSQRWLYPYWVTWSPDGEYLLFSAWPEAGRALLGVAPSVPGSPTDVLVRDTWPFEDPDDPGPPAFWEPSVPIQTWGRLISD
jgi:Tol biopolymer transport system component